MGESKMRKQMAEAFIAALKEDTIPWERNWDLAETSFNAVSEEQYRGINSIWLQYVGEEKGYSDPRWCTFRQADERGWRIKKGEKSTKIEYYSLYDKKEKKIITVVDAQKLEKELEPKEYYSRVATIIKNYDVFNAEQMEGIPARKKKPDRMSAEQILKQRDTLLKNMELKFEEGGDKAAYYPESDLIKMPPVKQFHNDDGYMSTFLHEAAHASGHPKRLSRDLCLKKGSTEYAREELYAEIASAFVSQKLGIVTEDTLDNHKAYIQSWIKILEENPNELFRAIKQGEKIADYLLEKGDFSLLQKEKISQKAVSAGMPDNKYSSFVSEHREELQSRQLKKRPLIVNAYGGPGCGNSTFCMDVCQQLKKLGYHAEYVQDYKSELVSGKNNWGFLDGSSEHQFQILKEQVRRIDRLQSEEIDFIVTDSPILLNCIYNYELTPEYEKMARDIQEDYSNFSYFIERDAKALAPEKDDQIKNLLEKNHISYDVLKCDVLNDILNNDYKTIIDGIVKDVVEMYKKMNTNGEIDYIEEQENVASNIEILGVYDWKDKGEFVHYLDKTDGSQYLTDGEKIIEDVDLEVMQSLRSNESFNNIWKFDAAAFLKKLKECHPELSFQPEQMRWLDKNYDKNIVGSLMSGISLDADTRQESNTTQQKVDAKDVKRQIYKRTQRIGRGGR